MVKPRVIKLRVKEGPNARDQTAFSASIHYKWQSKQMLATYMRRMRNNNLEIRITGSSCRSQLFTYLIRTFFMAL